MKFYKSFTTCITKKTRNFTEQLLHCTFCLQPSWFEKYPSFYHSPACEKLKAFVRSSIFENVIGFILILNLVAVIIETTVWKIFIFIISRWYSYQYVKFVFSGKFKFTWVFALAKLASIISLSWFLHLLFLKCVLDCILSCLLILNAIHFLSLHALTQVGS